MNQRDTQGQQGGYGDDHRRQPQAQDDDRYRQPSTGSGQRGGTGYGDRSMQQDDAGRYGQQGGYTEQQEARSFGGGQQGGMHSFGQGGGSSYDAQRGPQAHTGSGQRAGSYGNQAGSGPQDEFGHQGSFYGNRGAGQERFGQERQGRYGQGGQGSFGQGGQGHASPGSFGDSGEWARSGSQQHENWSRDESLGNSPRSGQGRYGGTGQDDQRRFDPDYHQWRSEQLRNLDDDYQAWQQERYKKFSDEFNTWRSGRRSQSQASGGSQSGSQSESQARSPDGQTPLAGLSTSSSGKDGQDGTKQDSENRSSSQGVASSGKK